MNKKEVATIARILTEKYPNPVPALKFSTNYELLVAVVLSAQCTDERVNKVTSELFKVANTPENMIALGQERLEKYIFSCGLYRSKTSHIISASRDIVDKFGGEVPSGLDELRSLAGVGRKTANVVYSVAFSGNAIAVDTHVFRVSNRLGIANGKTPLEVEKQLMAVLPEEKWSHMHHAIIFHGRQTCMARNPNCKACELSLHCKYYKAQGRA